MEQNFKGPEEAWGLIWRAVGAVMVSEHFTEKLRDEVSQARAAILTATQQAGDDEYDTTATVGSQLTFNDITTGAKYKYSIPNGKFSALNDRICTVTKKKLTRMETTLDHDWFNFKKGHKLTVYPNHLVRL